MEVYFALLIVIMTAILLLIKRTFYYWKGLGVHQFPLQIPQGNIKDVGKTRHISNFTIEYYQKTKKIGARFSGIYTYIRPVLLIADLELVKTIFVKDFSVFPNRGLYFNEKDDPISAHLFNLENDPWRNLRQKLSPTFTSGKLKMMFETINEVADKLLSVVEKQVESSGQLELKDTLARFTTDVIGSVAFGLDCNSLEDRNSKFYEMGTKIFTIPSSIFKRVMRQVFTDIARKLHVTLIPQEISDFYLGITRSTVDYREKNPQVNRQDFMNLLVQMKKSGDITVEQIAAQSFIFFLAGYETSSSTMTYCMYELSVNPEIQEKARQSAKEALEKHGSLTYEAVHDMEYLENCVSEALRKYPVVPILNRVPLRNYNIPDSDVVISKGQTVWIPVHAIHHDPEIYPDPEKFNPDRFTPEETAKRHPYAYLPFGEGPRICIGMRFAIVEMKLGLAKLLLKYKFSLDHSKTTSPLIIAPKQFVLTPTEQIFLNVERIQ